jgi:DNA repair photolyase
LTRGCLEVCARYRNPVGIITKSALIERDLDVLVDLHRTARLTVTVSVPLWDEAKARAIEPFVTTPARRIRIIERLARAGISVGVNVAPLIPGLSDEDVPAILEAAAAAGAKRAACIFLRLPGPVKAVFEERLRAAMPDRADKVLARVREARGGKLYDARFGARQRGDGPYAEAAMRLFEATAQRLGLETGGRDQLPTTFARPRAQLPLFPSS